MWKNMDTRYLSHHFFFKVKRYLTAPVWNRWILYAQNFRREYEDEADIMLFRAEKVAMKR